MPRRHKIAVLCVLDVNAAAFFPERADSVAALTKIWALVHSVCQHGQREESTPAGGTPFRFAPFRPLPLSPASLRDLYPTGPSPCPCPGVDTPPGGSLSFLWIHSLIRPVEFFLHYYFENPISLLNFVVSK